jgi:hypothetical protein
LWGPGGLGSDQWQAVAGSDQWAVGSGQWAPVGSGQWAVGSGHQWAVGTSGFFFLVFLALRRHWIGSGAVERQ